MPASTITRLAFFTHRAALMVAEGVVLVWYAVQALPQCDLGGLFFAIAPAVLEDFTQSNAQVAERSRISHTEDRMTSEVHSRHPLCRRASQAPDEEVT